MRRRDFLAAIAASALSAQSTPKGPRLLIGESDAFTGLPILKARYAAGRRPSDDMEGWALSWRLTGQETFAERAVIDGVNLKGAAFEQGPTVLFSSTGVAIDEGEVSLPDAAGNQLIVTSLEPESFYELNFAG